MVLYLLSLLGVVVFSASGALAAGKKHFDLMGVAVVSLATAIGGGTLRDILMDRHPIFWVEDTNYLWAVLIGAVLTLFYVRFRKPPLSALLIADALGLALFTISGAQLAEQKNFPDVIVVLMGAITGAAGGVARDILTREIPLLCRSTETLYATAAIGGASAYLAFEGAGVPRTSAALAGMAIVASLRCAAIVWNLRLPAFKVDDSMNQ